MLVAVLVLAAAAAALAFARLLPSGLPRPVGPAPGGNAPPVGRPAPDFSLALLNGGTLAFHSLKGKPVLLNFWASWCAPCREETPLLVRLHKVYGPRGVEFVGIDAEDQPADARRFIAEYHVDYAVAHADDERLIDAFEIPGLPTTVLIGADGIVVGKVVGGFVGPEGEKLLIGWLDRLLAAAGR
ncbi:MAG TPA: TlpA disulfide reductase family protein [bacterium]|nr:TlpA disulfide reductase family protein [bacterium]